MNLIKVKLVILLLFVSLACLATTTSSFSVNDAFQQNKSIKLNGEWDFYWEQLLTFDQLNNNELQPSSKIHIPGYWTQATDSIGQNFAARGYGTYVTQLILPKNYGGQIAFRIPSFDSSCKFYINDSLFFKEGNVGVDINSEVPGYNVETLNYFPTSDTLTLIIQVSNFHHRRGGFWRNMSVGPSTLMFQNMKREYILENLTLGILLAFGLFFLIFSIMNWQNAMFFFSFTFIFFFFRSISINNYAIQNIIPISWTWLIRTEYMATFLSILSSYWGVYLLYKTKFVKWVSIILSVGFVPILLTILIFPVSIFSYTIIIFYVYLFVAIVVFIAQSIALFRAHIFSFSYWVGILIIIFASVNDTLYSISSFYIFDFYLLKWAFFIFVIIQAIKLYQKFIETYQAERNLRLELSSLNKNLEKKIEERTEKIRNQNILVEKQKIIIEKQNVGLILDNKLKNKILSIIGHDLRSPLANIVHGFMFLNEESLNTPDARHIINKLSLSAESLVMLVENLLTWALNQDKNLKYILENRSLKPVFKNVVNQVAALALEKQITIHFECPDTVIAYFDEPSLTIVLRNLISNAIKYTPEQGKIDITAFPYNGMVKVEVRDNGVGINSEKLKQILNGEEFESNRGTNNEKGTGLGLQLCIDLIESNKGKLYAESVLGEGSCFSFTVPIQKNK